MKLNTPTADGRVISTDVSFRLPMPIRRVGHDDTVVGVVTSVILDETVVGGTADDMFIYHGTALLHEMVTNEEIDELAPSIELVAFRNYTYNDEMTLMTCHGGLVGAVALVPLAQAPWGATLELVHD